MSNFLKRMALAIALAIFCTTHAYADYVNVTDPSDPTLNFRTGPQLNSDIIDVLQQNTYVRVIEKRGKWALVELLDDRVGWVWASYLGEHHVPYVANFFPTHTIVSSGDFFANLRLGPSGNAAIATRAYDGDDVMHTGAIDGSWHQIRLPSGKKLWVHGSLITKYVP